MKKEGKIKSIIIGLLLLITLALVIFCVTLTYNYMQEDNDIEETLTNEDKLIVDMYTHIIKQIYEEEDALNHEITMISLILEDEELKIEQKETIFSNIKNLYGYEVIEKDYEQLKEEGYLSEDGFYFEEGIVITVNDVIRTSEGFKYSVSKWRSGLGAIGSNDNEIKLVDGTFSVTSGVFWIS